MSTTMDTSNISDSNSQISVVIKNDIQKGGLERPAWGSKLEFILTCIGAGIGLGNVWRFPYLLFKSGGGAFLIPFTLMLFLIGIPIFMLEISLGQFCSLSPISVFKISPILKGVGYAMVLTEMVVAVYYCVIISWCLYYFFCSFTSHLPWEGCRNPWNTLYCTELEEFINITKSNETYIIRDGINVSRVDLKTASEEFFYRKVLQMSDGIEVRGHIVWQLALCLFIIWLVVFLVLSNGIASLGKVVYFTSTFPYLLLTIMLVKGVTLEGSTKGIQFYMLPDWEKLTDLSVWSDAATQVFYSLSTCTGALIAMASYNPFHNNTIRDSFLVPICNFMTSIYAGFVIFSVLGYMAHLKGVEVADVAADGPGLVFVVYPEALSAMPVAPLWSALFFLMMMVLGMSSLFSMSESFFTSFSDEFPSLLRSTQTKSYIFRGAGIFCFYILSLPMVTNSGFYLFSLVDLYTGGFPLLVLAFFELILISGIYGNRRFGSDVAMMVGDRRVILMMFRFSWGVIAPIFIILSLIATGLSYSPPTLFNETYIYPLWAEEIGWLVVAFCLGSIPVYLFYYISIDLYKLVKAGALPEEDWGPCYDKYRTGLYNPLNSPPSQPDNTLFKEDAAGVSKRDVLKNDDGMSNKGYVDVASYAEFESF